MSGPLAGVRILDLTSVVMGPYATQILADLGADVVKVEAPEGDIMRRAGPLRHPGMGHIFLNANRNKRSIVLDLKKPQGREALLALARRMDALLYNIRPQSMARLGLSYAEVAAVNPRIVYVGAFGYGQDGPYAGKAAYDDLIQGAAGIPWLLKESGAAEPRYVPATMADRTVGLHMAYATLGALYSRERTGRGQAIEVPMFECLLQLVLGEHLGGETFDPPLAEAGYSRMLAKNRKPYATRDGYVCVLIYTDRQWKSFFRLIGREELYHSDPRYSTQQARIAHIDELYGFVAEVMKARTTEDWLRELAAADIPVMRMNSLDDILRDPHLAAVGYFGRVEHPTEGALRALAVPTRWSETRPGYRRHAPRLGEHSRELLAEAGYSEADVERLIRAGVTRAAD
ncbi:MAG: CoA transferase [Betaproteobacteria bacterium]|nr:CoA transferase [Betaproteobacteria bacterium]